MNEECEKKEDFINKLIVNLDQNLRKTITDIDLKRQLWAESAVYRIWVRYGSWEKNQEVVLDLVDFKSAKLDRALYKSANQVALQTLAQAFVNGQKACKPGDSVDTEAAR
jgi:hypothetical protein